MRAVHEKVTAEIEGIDELRSLLTSTPPSMPFLRVDRPPDERLSGRVWLNNLGAVGVDVIEMDAAPHHVRRTDVPIQSAPTYIGIFQIEGESRVAQGEAAAHLHAGEWTFAMSTLPFDWHFLGDFRAVQVRIPQTVIDITPSRWLDVVGHVFDGETARAGDLLAFISTVASRPSALDSPAGSSIGLLLVGLIDAAVREHADEAVARGEGPDAAPFRRLTAYIADHLRDSGLNATTIAAAHFMSVRSVQSVFQLNGTTLTRWIRESRLDAVKRDLASPARAGHTIGEIGREWGLTDSAHLTKAFRREYGLTPSQWRSDSLRDRP